MDIRKLSKPSIGPFQGDDSVRNRQQQKDLAASSLIHDLNNLFQHMQIRLFLLAKDAGPAQKSSLEALTRSLSLAIQRANFFLDFTRDRSKTLESLDLAKVIEAAVEAVDTQSTEIVCELSTGLQVTAHTCDLAFVLANLIQNAREAMRVGQRGTVVITARRKGDAAIVTVEDDGCGIPTKDLTRIFDYHFTTKKNGSGLGLSSARDVCKEFGGDLLAANRPEGGAVFTLWLPLNAEGLKNDAVAPEDENVLDELCNDPAFLHSHHVTAADLQSLRSVSLLGNIRSKTDLAFILKTIRSRPQKQ